jgi:uncharacterized OsmC-like protein
MSTVRDSQKPLKTRYSDDPSEAIKAYRIRSVAHDLSDPFHARVRSEIGAGAGATFGVAIDPKLGGPGGGPTPGDILLASLAACQDTTVRMIADVMGIGLLELEVTVTGEVDVRGSLMLSRDVPVGFKRIGCTTRITVRPGTPAEATRKLAALAEHCCIIRSTLSSGPKVDSSFDVKAG